MRLLLDTHVAIWAVLKDARLTARARKLIEASPGETFFSAASIWEIAIKHAQSRGGRDDMKVGAQEAVALFISAGFEPLPISPAHAAAVESLPSLHADPFDRLLLAQAITEPLRLLTRDTKLLAYGGMTLAA